MKTRSLTAAAVVVLALGAALPAVNWAQDDLFKVESDLKVESDAQRVNAIALREAEKAQKMAEKAIARSAADVKRVEEIRVRQFMPGWTGFPGSKGLPRHLTRIQDAAEKYRDGADEAQKEAALKQLKGMVSQYFEEDMQVRKKELADIEARLEKLRSQLDRRRAKKDEIVELQVKVAINEAEGLGFTSAPREDFKYNFRVAAPVIAPLEAAKFDVMTAPQSSDLFGPPVRVEVQAPNPVPVPTPPSPPSDDPLSEHQLSLGVGAKGDGVRLLQKVINNKLQPSPELQIDGDFGPETERALRAFQAEHGLKETGVVDEATREKLELPAELPPFING